MVATPKYKAKVVYWDSSRGVVIGTDEIEKYRVKGKFKFPDGIFRFDSQHEFKVYLELCRMYGAKRIERQFKVQVFPSGLCYRRGKNWRVDFAILTGGSHPLPYAYVEAKGAFLPEFGFILAAVEHLRPDIFNSLYIAFSDSIPVHNRVIGSLMNSVYDSRLLTLEELKCLKHLPFPL